MMKRKKRPRPQKGKVEKKEGRLVSIQTKEEAEEDWRGGERGNLYKRRGGRGRREITVPWPPAVVSTRPEGGRDERNEERSFGLARACVCVWWLVGVSRVHDSLPPLATEASGAPADPFPPAIHNPSFLVGTIHGHNGERGGRG